MMYGLLSVRIYANITSWCHRQCDGDWFMICFGIFHCHSVFWFGFSHFNIFLTQLLFLWLDFGCRLIFWEWKKRSFYMLSLFVPFLCILSFTFDEMNALRNYCNTHTNTMIVVPIVYNITSDTMYVCVCVFFVVSSWH